MVKIQESKKKVGKYDGCKGGVKSVTGKVGRRKSLERGRAREGHKNPKGLVRNGGRREKK